MFYHIYGFCPRTDIDMGRCGFAIKLWPSWKKAIEKSGITQKNIDCAINSYHRQWLDGCGFDRMYDPDEDVMDRFRNEKKKLGPNARHLYDKHSIHIRWGEWGPEHITVPGNACGLDISNSIGSPSDGAVLEPHNVDSFGQQILLATIFTTFADHIICDLELKNMNARGKP